MNELEREDSEITELHKGTESSHLEIGSEKEKHSSLKAAVYSTEKWEC